MFQQMRRRYGTGRQKLRKAADRFWNALDRYDRRHQTRLRENLATSLDVAGTILFGLGFLGSMAVFWTSMLTNAWLPALGAGAILFGIKAKLYHWGRASQKRRDAADHLRHAESARAAQLPHAPAAEPSVAPAARSAARSAAPAAAAKRQTDILPPARSPLVQAQPHRPSGPGRGGAAEPVVDRQSQPH